MRAKTSNVVVKKPSLMVKLYLLPPFFKMLLAVLLFFIICMGGFSFLQQQSIQDAAQLKLKKSILEGEVYAGARSRGEMKYLTINSSTSKQRYEALLKIFPPESKVSDLLANITKLGADDGVKFVSFTPQSTIKHDYYAETSVLISVVGHFHALGRYLSGIANLPGSMIGVNQFSIIPAHDSDAGGDLLSLQFTATVYYALANSADNKI